MPGQFATVRLVRSANSAAARCRCSSSLCGFSYSPAQLSCHRALVLCSSSAPFIGSRNEIRGTGFLKEDKGLHCHHFCSTPLQANHGGSSKVRDAYSTKMARDGIIGAIKAAQQYRQQVVNTEHLMKALLEHKDGLTRTIFLKARIDTTNVLQAIDEYISQQPKVIGDTSSPILGQHLRTLLANAPKYKEEFGDELLSVEHLVLAFCSDVGFGQQLFKDLKLSEKELRDVVTDVRGNQRVAYQNHEGKYKALEKYGSDLTELAKCGKLGSVICHDDELQHCIQILCKKTKNNPVIIGEPNVGKIAIVERLAQQIVLGDVPTSLLDRKLISLDIGALVAGAKLRGEFEKRLKAVMKEVSSSNGQIILFIDEIHTVVDAGAAYLLKPELDQGEFCCIGATTLSEYKKYIEKDSALERRFQKVYCSEPSVEDTILILNSLRQNYELNHHVKISNSALVASAVLSDRYITERILPDKAIDLIDAAAVKLKKEIASMPIQLDEEVVREQWEQEKSLQIKISLIKEEIDRVKLEMEADVKYDTLISLRRELQKVEQNLATCRESGKLLFRKEVTDFAIAEIVSRQTGIPVSNLQQSERDKLIHLEEHLHKRVVGQDIAVKSVTDVICRSRVGLSDQNRPIASFMFMGPTGVGKIELAKALAEYYFNTENALVRIDMSEYMEADAVSRLVGAPACYMDYDKEGQLTEYMEADVVSRLVGAPACYMDYDKEGQLTEVVRRRPYSVVLFEEIEKAHYDVFNILLQLLDDGKITDSQGRVVKFKNTIVIFTSNVASHFILDTLQNTHGGEDAMYELMKKHVLELASQTFRPVFVNNIDKFIVFKPLDTRQNNSIVEMQLDRVKQKFREKNIFLSYTPTAVKLLENLSLDANFGARPVNRVIQEMVEIELARGIVRRDFKEDDSVIVDADHSLKDVPLLKKLVIKKLDVAAVAVDAGVGLISPLP